MPKQLADVPPMPPELGHLWQYYNEIRSGEPLTFTEIHSWSKLTCRYISAQETSILKSLDNIFRNVANEQRNRQPNN